MRRARRLAAVVAVLVTVPCSLAAASASLSGSYVTTVTSAGALDGRYEITFSPGRFTLHAPYGIVGHGTYAISGQRITLHGPSKECQAAGLYEFRISGSTLSFKKIKDPCPRAAVLTAHPLKRT